MTPQASFSLTRAGPFYEALRSSHIVGRDGRIHWLRIVAIVWLPLMLAAAWQTLRGQPLDVLVRDPSVHVRLLLSIPLLLFAEHVLETRCRTCIDLLREEQLAEPVQLQPVIERAERLRASRLVETLLALAALLGGQAALWGLSGPSGLIHGLEGDDRISFAAFWYATISLPLLQFLVLRWLWRWGIWCYVLVKLSRMPLATNALHPDSLAGLKLLSGPADAFGVFVAANMCVASAAWIAQVRELGVELEAFVPRFIAFVALATILACGPLLLFSGHIYRARYRDVGRYHALAFEYVREFRRKWVLAQSQHAGLLGTPDLQSLNDLDGSFQLAEQTSPLPFGKRPVLIVWVGCVVPMIPLALATMPAAEIVRQLGRMLQLPAF